MAGEKILVVDDEHLIRWSLEKNLSKQGYDVTLSETGEEALAKIDEQEFDLVLLDLKLPGIGGVDVLRTVRKEHKHLPVVIITAHAMIDTAVEAMKLGAYDYIEKPFNFDQLTLTVRKGLETVGLRREVVRLQSEREKTYGPADIIGTDDKTKEVLRLGGKLAGSEATTVLLQGASGTGKDLVARAIHYRSPRRDKPFMAVNCTALPETLLESELLGHEKGAFTDAKVMKKGLLEVANRGTIFLDEIGDMKMSMQAKLLRVVEDKMFKRVGGTRDIKVDLRIVASTNRPLEQAVREGRFREDLYYRLKVVVITLPALREHKKDIPMLVSHFIDQYRKEFRRNITGISKDAQDCLLRYDWPGNVRELKNVLERAIILESEEVILAAHLPPEVRDPSGVLGQVGYEFKLPPGGISVQKVERDLVVQALAASGGNQVQAARLLGLSRDALRRRMKKFALAQ